MKGPCSGPAGISEAHLPTTGRPSGTSYDASSASACINADAGESCTDVSNEVTPTRCSHICQ